MTLSPSISNNPPTPTQFLRQSAQSIPDPCYPFNAAKSLSASIRHSIKSDPFCQAPLLMSGCVEQQTQTWGTTDVILLLQGQDLMMHEAMFLYEKKQNANTTKSSQLFLSRQAPSNNFG